MATTRSFQVSADLFWGFRMTIDLCKDVELLDDIVPLCLQRMRDFFKKHNLLALVDKIDGMQLHHHFPVQWRTLQDVLDNTVASEIIYLCDHCHKHKTD